MSTDHSTGTETIEVLVFGMQSRAIGADRVTLNELSFPVAASEVLTLIARVSPELSASMGVSRLAINHEFADSTTLIHAGDEVALVGLISGG